MNSGGTLFARERIGHQWTPVTRPPRKLLDQVRDAIRTRHYSRRTEVAYVSWIRQFIIFHQKAHPSTLGAAEIGAFLTWLATRRRVSASSQNQALAALLFLYERVLEAPLGRVEHVVRAKQPLRLPVVLSRDEVEAVLSQLEGTM
jgi:site-specific recombinase XerD